MRTTRCWWIASRLVWAGAWRLGEEGIPQGLKPQCRGFQRPKAKALGYLEASSRYDYFFVSPPICTTKYLAGPVPMLVILWVVPSAT